LARVSISAAFRCRQEGDQQSQPSLRPQHNRADSNDKLYALSQ
jgi:hypothetical protein